LWFDQQAQMPSASQQLPTLVFSNVYRASGATMDIEGAFITRLIGFGLSEKEAQLYLHLLKYGPKTPSPLANR
jgi:Sugar-specific transcriptional regulator TrmB.